MRNCDPLQGRGVSFLIAMRRLVSFVDRTRVESALVLGFLISLAWVAALALLLKTGPTPSVNAGSNPPSRHQLRNGRMPAMSQPSPWARFECAGPSGHCLPPQTHQRLLKRDCGPIGGSGSAPIAAGKVAGSLQTGPGVWTAQRRSRCIVADAITLADPIHSKCSRSRR
jgi:hypothetical protein